MRRALMGILVLAALVIGTSTAKAQTEITLSSGTKTVTASGVGSVTYSSSNFNGWSVFLEVGASNSPNLGPFYGLDLISVLVSCPSGACLSAPLDVYVSDTGFTQTVLSGGFSSSYGSTQSGTGANSTQTAWDSTSNAIFGEGTLIGTIPFSGTGGFSGSVSGGGPAGPSAYSLTLEDAFSANGSTASFGVNNGDIGPTPEPGSMLLYGSGLLVFGGILRRRLLTNRAH